SGPALAARTAMPRCLSAASRASVTVVLPEPERGAATMSPRAVMSDVLRGDGMGLSDYRQGHEPARPSAPPGLDHRGLRHRGGEGRLCGVADGRLPRSGRGYAAARRTADFRARGKPSR